MEDVSFYTFDYFFFLRVVFDMFNIIFHFCYLKSKFWSGFSSKISFRLHLRHMRMARLQDLAAFEVERIFIYISYVIYF